MATITKSAHPLRIFKRWIQFLNAEPLLEFFIIGLLGAFFILIHASYVETLYYNYNLSFKAILEKDMRLFSNPFQFLFIIGGLTALLFASFRKLQQYWPKLVRLTFYGLVLYYSVGFLLILALFFRIIPLSWLH